MPKTGHFSKIALRARIWSDTRRSQEVWGFLRSSEELGVPGELVLKPVVELWSCHPCELVAGMCLHVPPVIF